ncbi:MAG: glycosyltransferase [Acidimicrobiales bacterium]
MVLLLVLWGIVQFSLLIVCGYLAPSRVEPGPQEEIELAPSGLLRMGVAERFDVFFLIACLEEEAVIGDTVAAVLREDPRSTVVVVDDGSDDDTAGEARRAGGDRLIVCRRALPEARQGKGAALNTGYRALVAEVDRRGLDPDRVLVVVMDADGRLSDGAVGRAITRFQDPTVGGVQLPVRIRNRETLIGQLQDFEFWGVSALAQVARIRSHSVSLGGNGQFTRLSALLPLGAPWSDALTEDLDLSVTLLAAGWRLSSTPDAHVTQQGVEDLAALVRQRTRWYQGHIVCAGRIPELWRSNRLPGLGFVEVTAYLVGPLALVIPWSVLFTWGMVEQVRPALEGGGLLGDGTPAMRIVVLVGWYLLSFAPMHFAAFAYHRRSDSGVVRSVAMAHLAVLSSYVTFVATWRAVGRILLKRNGWVKTVRHVEAVPGPALAEVGTT